MAQRPVFVFAPATFNLAETTRMIEVAKQLSPRYDCQFFGFSRTFADWITKAGFAFTLLTPVLTKEQERQIIALDQMKGLTNPFTEEMVAQRVQNELAFLQQQKPRAVVTGSNVTIFLSARIAKFPLVYIKPYALSRPQLTHQTGSWAKKSVDQLMLKIPWKPRAFKKIAQQYDLKLPKYTIDMLDGDQNLITTFREFTNVSEYPPNYHNVGPIFAHLDTQLPANILRLIQESQEKPIVYLALGSSGNQRLAKRILAILKETEYVVLAPLKQYLVQEAIQSFAGTSIHITDLLPAPLLAPYVQFSIIHGGEGTVQTACLSGKPFIGFGLQQEQKMNLHDCQEYGNAIRLDPLVLTRKKLLTAIETIQTPSYLKKAQELAHIFDGDGAKRAAAFIEKTYEQ
ncbi:glycosyl transferase [Enterococcus florum]|uniref:Glycosyl transferase n=1 Tax=Enterococcus florum TaxID=2480627 RepID=A0A4P5PAP0_9ENTE|nr:hypothetical protein [Enterococcus florum]GCF93048.1 glycosyl transferase [Enterococcus florum]